MRKILGLLMCLAASSALLHAQPIEVTPSTTDPYTPENLITNVFLGDGVEVLSVQFDGDPIAVGFFKNATDEIGIERGIVMTSGRAANQGTSYGADGVGSNFASNNNDSNVSDPDVTAISSATPYDIARYTITFIPTADTLRFRYVWGSEEYPEYACSQFNDVFGFFISGPGINGPYENNGINIALIPETNLPVTINNLNSGEVGSAGTISNCTPPNGSLAYSQYYIDNDGSSNQPVYDGYTTVLTAEAVVIPCETYTIKLVIADNGDGIFDSGVFLEAKSFGTGSLEVEVATASLDGTVTEDCAQGLLTFKMPQPVESDFYPDYTIFGTAENGVDYEFISDSLFIPAGDSIIQVPIIAFDDGIDEGIEYIALDVQRDVCNRDTFYIYIRDNELLPPSLGPDTTICRGDTVQLDGTLPIQLPDPPTFTNTQDYLISPPFTSIYSPIQVAGVQPFQLGPGVIRSVCINISSLWDDDLDIFLIAPGGQFLELSTDNGADGNDYTNTCFTPSSPIPINFPGPVAPASAAPFTGNFQPEGPWSDLWDGDSPTNGTWQLLIIDDAQGFDNSVLLDWSITFEPLYQVYYRWEPAAGLSCSDCPTPQAFPDTTTTYYLTAWDSYGCEVYDTITIEVLPSLDAPDVQCSTVTDSTVTFAWSPQPGALSYEVNVDGTGWVPADAIDMHTVTGLSYEQTVNIQVRAVTGMCPSLPGSATCITPPCPGASPSLDSLHHVTCNGGNDGAVFLSATGPDAPFTFSVAGQTNSTGVFTGLVAGAYTATITDNAGCSITLPFGIDQPTALEADISVLAEISCAGANDGSLAPLVSGGVWPYSFQWQDGNTDSLRTFLGPGTWEVTITDANGCTQTVAHTLVSPQPLFLFASAENAKCHGAADGAVFVVASGGSPPYSYQWDSLANHATTSFVTDLPAGTYSVTVTDAAGCAQTTQTTISEPPPITLAFDVTAPSCFDSADGQVIASASGGNQPYSWSWNGGPFQGSPILDDLGGGWVYLTVQDNQGCTATDSVFLAQPDTLEIALQPDTVSCAGSADGSLTVQFLQGYQPTDTYTYSWDAPGQTDSMATGLTAGTWCVTVTNQNGCTATACAEIAEPEALTLDHILDHAGCSGANDGSIAVQPSGGTPPYQYSWAHGDTDSLATGLGAGSYEVTVTDAHGCTASMSFTVEEATPLELSFTATDVACFGDATGSIDLQVDGGTPPYVYLWSGPNGFSSDQPSPGSLVAGDYFVTVTDALGCTASLAVSIAQPASALSVSLQQTNPVLCHQAANGALEAYTSGGTPPYTYTWSTGSQSAQIDGLGPGAYAVTVTDAQGCTASANAAFDALGEILIELEATDASCHNGSDGQAVVTGIRYGSQPADLQHFVISWSTSPPQFGAQAFALQGGQTYTVTATDTLGCTGTATVTIGNPPSIGYEIEEVRHVTCPDGADGSIRVRGQGGVPPYSYQWDANAGSQTSATATGLAAGTYAVTIADANGCTTQASATLTEPDPWQVSFKVQDVDCYNAKTGSIEAIVAGATPPYGYVWENGHEAATIENIAAGTYGLTITDARGCSYTTSATVSAPGEPISATFDTDDVSCFGYSDGKIYVYPDGGTPPYTFSVDGRPFVGASTLLGLSAGHHFITIRDSKGCEWQSQGVFIDQPDPIVVDLGPDTTINFGDEIRLVPQISNADTIVRYIWSPDDTAVVHYPDWARPFVRPLAPTLFELVVEDQNGCRGSDQKMVFVATWRNVQVPSGFSPNGDGLNDLLRVHGDSDVHVDVFRVFDRWGEMLYEATDFQVNDAQVGWDGTFQGQPMPQGVYIWYVEATFQDGSKAVFKGNTTLIR